MKQALMAALLAAVLLSAAAPTALAGGLLDDQVVFGDEFTLPSGQTIHGSLIVFGGNVTLEAGSTVAEDVIIYGGNLDAAGKVDGDVVAYGGNLDLRQGAEVDGQLVTWGGSVHRDPEATVRGGEISGFGSTINIPRLFPRLSRLPDLRITFRPFTQAVEAVLWASALAALALLVLLFWPDQTARVGHAALAAPAAAGGLGLLTAVLAVPLGILLIITICLAPIALLGWLALFGAGIYGWLAIGQLVGQRLAGALKMTGVNPALTGALGTFILTLTSSLLTIIPCIGGIIGGLLAVGGLGAVLLTRFGTRVYLPPSGAPLTPIADGE